MANADDFDDTYEAEEPQQRGRNTGLTILLCLLNVAAALGFTFLLVLDFQKRQQWSYAVFLHDLYMQGLPLKEEDDGPSASRVTMPKQRLSSEQIKAVFSARGGKGGGGDEFQRVEEVLHTRIMPKHLSPEILKEYFGDLGEGVATLEQEIDRLKTKVPADIAQVARETVTGAKDEAAKRQLVVKLLLPLTYDIYQVEALDKKIKAATGLSLAALLEDAVQRRMLLDILGPCEIHRPGDVKTFLVEKAVDLDKDGQYAIKVTQLKSLLQDRFEVATGAKYKASVHLGQEWEGEPRTSIEKRRTISHLLLTLAYLRKPDGELLYPRGLERAQTVVGLFEIAGACQALTAGLQKLEEKVIDAIKIDRQGYSLKGTERTEAFIDRQPREVKRIQDLITDIRLAERRLKDLQEQRDRAKKIFEERKEHLDSVTKKLLAARAETGRLIAQLRELQLTLFRAQVELSEAADRNFLLEEEIRKQEKLKGGAKGATTP